MILRFELDLQDALQDTTYPKSLDYKVLESHGLVRPKQSDHMTPQDRELQLLRYSWCWDSSRESE